VTPLTQWRTALGDLPKQARVVTCCRSGPELAEIVGECLDRGLVAVPVEPRTGTAQLTDIVERVSASLVVDGRGATVSAAATGHGRDHPEADDLAFIMFTSGSTGRPKGVVLDRSSVFGNASKIAALLGFTPERPHATCLPLYHVNALMMSLVGTRLTGTPLELCERFEPVGYFQRIAAAGAVTASIVPALLARLLEVRPPWPDTLEFLVTAAAPLGSELAERFYRAYGPRLRQGYGLSEAVNFSFMMPLLDAHDFREHYIAHHPPVGLPLPATEYRLDDGEVVLRTPDVMRGYWEDPAATAEAFAADGWLRTGDLGERRAGFLVLRGRRKELINRGGEKYYPVDVEHRWRAAGLTGTFAAVPVPVDDLGEDVGLVVDGGSVATARALYAQQVLGPIAASSSGWMATSTGKPLRLAMGRRLTGRRDSVDRYEDLLRYARRSAESILGSGHPPTGALASRLYAQAAALSRVQLPDREPSSTLRSVAHDALDALVEYWPALADGTGDGQEMMRRRPGLWKRLMVEWPMGSYAELVRDVLCVQDLLEGRVLEVGTGVGNTTELIAPKVTGDFTWSDRSAELVRRGTWPGRGVVFDFDCEPPTELTGFDVIVGTNAVRSMLSDGGVLLLAEGSNPTTPAGTPWALDAFFCAFDGWWDRGGFLTRWEWLSLLERAGFGRLGYSVLRAGRHDLGGVVWGSRV
jgi:hypothetical protein